MRQRNCSGVMFKLILIVFQSRKFKGNMSPKKASILKSMKGEMKNLEESRRLANWLKAGSVTMAAELKQRDISQIQKLGKNMSPTKEVVMLLVQSIKWLTKKTEVVHSEVTQG